MNNFTPVPDKIFLAPDGSFVGTADIAHQIERKCPYVSRVVLATKNDRDLAALVVRKANVPAAEHLEQQKKGCFCPSDIEGLGRCLSECMDEINESIGSLHTRIGSFAVVNEESGMSDNGYHASESLIRRYEHCLNCSVDSAKADEFYFYEVKS